MFVSGVFKALDEFITELLLVVKVDKFFSIYST